MFHLRNKKILLLSQQDWGKMFISKHHYAVELARLGNQVYFINSPVRFNDLKPGEIKIKPTEYEGLHVVKHRFFHPYVLKHKARAVHNFLLKFHLKNIVKKVGGNVDIVWSFDVSNTIPLSSFSSDLFKIFMPVDEPSMPSGALGAKSARVMFSVTQEILDKYSAYNIPKKFINHGVQDIFINKTPAPKTDSLIRVGISGNFLRKDIDWECLMEIITTHPDVIFNFWGAFDISSSNLSDERTSENNVYREQLSNLKNVLLHGIVDTVKLSEGIKEMDCCLICYDIDKDFSGGTNYHKILEYMATGKVIVANNTTTYETKRELVEMPVERNNSALPALFHRVINNLDYYNSPEKQAHRIEYAKQHTYAKNIERIERFINENVFR